MTTLAHAWFNEFLKEFASNEEYLGDLDRQAGDGDFAVNLGSGLKRAQKRIQLLSGSPTDAEVFSAISLGFLDTGGTSGPLLGMWFRGIARALDDGPLTTTGLSEGIATGTETIQRLGGAKVGDKTMVDAMVPASEALKEAAGRDGGLADALAKAAESASKGAQSTKEITASLGRASYVGDLSTGVVDPGAEAIALFFAAGAAAAS